MKAIRLKRWRLDTDGKGYKLTRASEVRNIRDPVTLDLFCETGWSCWDRLGEGIKVDQVKLGESIKSLVSHKKIDKKRAGWKLLLWFSCSLSHRLGTWIFAASSSSLTHKWPHLRHPCTQTESKGAEAMGTHWKAGGFPIFHCGSDQAQAQVAQIRL